MHNELWRNVLNTTVWKFLIPPLQLSHFFGKNFVKVTVLLKKLLDSWFDEFFFPVRENFSFFYSVDWNITLTSYFCQKFREKNHHDIHMECELLSQNDFLFLLFGQKKINMWFAVLWVHVKYQSQEIARKLRKVVDGMSYKWEHYMVSILKIRFS